MVKTVLLLRGSFPGLGIRILQAAQSGQKKKKKKSPCVFWNQARLDQATVCFLNKEGPKVPRQLLRPHAPCVPCAPAPSARMSLQHLSATSLPYSLCEGAPPLHPKSPFILYSSFYAFFYHHP